MTELTALLLPVRLATWLQRFKSIGEQQKKSDVYSLGLILLELAKLDPKNLAWLKKIGQGCVNGTPESRPTAGDLVEEIKAASVHMLQGNQRPQPSPSSPPKPDVVPDVGNRVALVIGIQKYKSSPLSSAPKHDAEEINEKLKALKFATTCLYDINLQELEEAVNDFLAKLKPNTIAFFYFAGHACQVSTINYLEVVDNVYRSESEIRYKCYPLQSLLDGLEEKNPLLGIVVVDACRVNPKLPRSKRSGKPPCGLAPPPALSSNIITAFACQNSQEADDIGGGNGHSPYTSSLLKHLVEPGLEIPRVFARVRGDLARLEQNPTVQLEVNDWVHVYSLNPK